MRFSVWMATQQIGEFLEKEHGKKILSVVGTKFLMGVSPFEAQRMQAPFELSETGDGGKDYSAEYSEKLPRDQRVRSGEIIFSDNFRSAQEPITFFNLFFRALLDQVLYEDYEARPQRLLCSGNRRRGSVELLLADRQRQEEDEALKVEEEDSGFEEMDMHAKEAHLIALKIKEVLLGDDPLYEYVRSKAGKSAVSA